MADDRKSDSAASETGDASPKAAAAPTGAPGIRRDPPIIDAKATDVTDAAAKDEAKTDAAKTDPAKTDAHKATTRPAAPGPAGTGRPAAAPQPPARERESGVRAGTAALLGGVAGAALAIAAMLFFAPRGDADAIAALNRQLAAMTKRVGDVDAQTKAAATAAAEGAGVAREAQGLAAAASQAAEANKVAIAALPKPTAAPDLQPVATRLAALEKFAGDARAAIDKTMATQTADADRLARVEARPVVTLDRIDQRVAALEQSSGAYLKPMQDRLAAIETRQASIETASVAATAAAQKAATMVEERIAKTDKTVADTGQSVAAAGQAIAQTGQRLGALEQRVQSLDLKPLAERVAALDNRVAPVEAKIAEQSSAIDGANARAAQTLAYSQATRAAVAADGVLRALANGRPFAGEVTTLEASGVAADALAPLKPFADKGAPTAAALAAQFAPLEEAVVAASAPPPQASFGDRLLSAAGRVVKVRRIGDPAAVDAPSLVARIDEALGRGDVADALAAFTALPEPSRRAAAGFGEALSARARADEAARTLARDAYASLGRAKN
jgi:hypothetical protein